MRPPPAATRDRVAAPVLALLAGPLSFGIAGPALVLDDAARDLGVSSGAVTWVVTAFGWGIAVGTPLTAGLLGRHGVRRTLIGCAALVSAGAVLTTAMPVPAGVVLGVVLQALGAAGFTAVAMSLADSARRMGLVTASLAVVGSTAPLVGSLVADLASWRATLVLPAVGALAVPAVLRHAGRRPASGAVDLLGGVLLGGTVTALVFVPHQPWVAAPAALVGVLLLVRHVRVRPDGFLPAAVARSPRFLAAAGLAFALAVVNFGLMYVLPRRLSGWTSAEIGFAMLWPLLLGGALSWFVVAGTAKARHGVVAAVLVGLGVAGAVVAALTADPAALLVAQGAASIAASSGQGVFAVRATTAVPATHRPAAIGLFTLCYLLGAAFGPAIVALLPS
ncbi:MFS transporter [Actinosynnema sp. CS-041913]|uniref:MFS transporter n=1 Tax=Actinosynnema sp. CS-041913 TaxID=3239917 RepID=UPI003D94D0BB